MIKSSPAGLALGAFGLLVLAGCTNVDGTPSTAQDSANTAWTNAKDGAHNVWNGAKDGATTVWDDVQHPGYLGRIIYPEPPPVTVVHGGPPSKLLTGPYFPEVPDSAVDQVISPALRPWLTFEERKSLADASEIAAVGAMATPVAWESKDGGGTVTAMGNAVAIGGAYRSLRGQICRDVRQTAAKNKEPHVESVTLCRTPAGSSTPIWVVADAG